MYSLYSHFSISRCCILFFIFGCYVNSINLNQLDLLSREACIPYSYEGAISEFGLVVLTRCEPYAGHVYNKILFANNIIWQSTDGIISYAVWIDETYKIVIVDLLYPNGHKSCKCFKQVGNKWEDASVTGYFLFGDIDERTLSLIPKVDKSTSDLITAFVDSEEINANYNKPFPHLGSIETTSLNDQYNGIKSFRDGGETTPDKGVTDHKSDINEVEDESNKKESVWKSNMKGSKPRSHKGAATVSFNEDVDVIYHGPIMKPATEGCFEQMIRHLLSCIVTFYSERR